MRLIRGRTAVVTGASSGIGRAIALQLAGEGVHLYLIDRETASLGETAALAARQNVHVQTEVADLSRLDLIADLVAKIQAACPDIHILINCAGTVAYGPVHLIDEQTMRNLMNVNLLAPMELVRALLPNLIAADEAHIVNICSIAGLVPVKRMTAYQASKYGLVGFTMALRNDYQRETFGVTAICPGFVRTPMVAGLKDREAHRAAPQLPDFLLTSPEVVASKTIDAIRRGKGLVVISPFARTAWWIARAFPFLLDYASREGWRQRGSLR
jgi:3-oxoacyl-[acyl-carrier protein] reductase